MDTVATLDVKVTADASQFQNELGNGRAFIAGAAVITGAAALPVSVARAIVDDDTESEE